MHGDVNFTLTDTQLTGAGTDTVIDTEFATLNGGSSGNVIDTSGTTTLIAAINGLGGADTITGGSPGELIDGGDGNDTINAGGGDDTIDAGAGDDQTDGQAGSDRLVVSANSNLVVTDSQSGGDGNTALVLQSCALHYRRSQELVLQVIVLFCLNVSVI